VRWLLTAFGLKGAMPPAVHLAVRRVRSLEGYAPPWLAPSLARSWLDNEEAAFVWKRIAGPRWWAHVVHAVTRGVGSALVYEQNGRMAAMAGLDARHPLVDVDVIELVLRLAPELAFDTRLTRPLLRDSVAGLLPDEVRLRPAKSNFDALFHAALAGSDLPPVRRVLGARDAELGAYVDLGTMHRMLLAADPPSDRRGRQLWATNVWRLVTAECWLRSQGDSTFPERLREREALAAGDLELVTRG
jgi:hypothetical protein